MKKLNILLVALSLLFVACGSEPYGDSSFKISDKSKDVLGDWSDCGKTAGYVFIKESEAAIVTLEAAKMVEFQKYPGYGAITETRYGVISAKSSKKGSQIVFTFKCVDPIGTKGTITYVSNLAGLAGEMVVVDFGSYKVKYGVKKHSGGIEDGTTGVRGEYPEGSVRELTMADLIDKSTHDLMIMRNEIYARNGFIFYNEELKSHFGMMRWYVGTTRTPNFTYIEQKNIMFIKSVEDARTSGSSQHSPTTSYQTSYAGIPGMFPQGSARELYIEELRDMSDHDLLIMRNEIYARNGFIFYNAELKAHFGAQSWYNGYTREPSFTYIEQKNIMLIKSVEDARKGA